MSASRMSGRGASWGGWVADLGLLAALVLVVFAARLTALPIRGEESRWAQVAYEMLQTGDWLVPRQQGLTFADRPPLHSWSIAAVSLAVGDVNLLSVRLPSVVCVLLTVVGIYCYARQFLSRVGALAAGAAYPTMLHVLELGRLGETDAMLTLFLSASLLVWHTGYMRRWPAWFAWSAGGVLAALGALTKGPQAPAYFAGGTIWYLVLQRDWRYLASWSHAAGWGVFAAVLGAWLVPFTLAQDLAAAASVWTQEGHLATRFMYPTAGEALVRWTRYPIESFGAMLPWSLALLCFASRDFRRSLGSARPYVRFLATCSVVAFPTCWLPAYSVPRYFMPLYPCVACLVGVAIERGWTLRQQIWWQRGWGVSMAALAVVAGLTATALGTGSLWAGEAGPALTLTAAHGVLFAVVAIVLGGAALWAMTADDQRRVRVGILAAAGFVGLVCVGPVTDHLIRTSADTEEQVAELRNELPPHQSLVSFGLVHHRFAYYFREPIGYRRWPSSRGDVDPSLTYFCFEASPRDTPALPFAWERVAVVSCDRRRRPLPSDAVIIGRRIEATARSTRGAAAAPQ